MNLKFWQKAVPGVEFRLEDPAWKGKLAALKQQLALLPAEHPVLVGMTGLIERNVATELEVSVRPGVSDADRHRFAGRLGMLLDLKAEWEKLQREAKAKE